MYVLVTKSFPEYLCNIIKSFETFSHRPSRFRLQGGLNTPICRTDVYKKSPLISCIYLWNKLDITIRSAPSLPCFKYKLKLLNTRRASRFYHTPNRNLQVSFMQLRLGFSNLNYDLNTRNCVPDSSCSCGHLREDAHHFFLHCPLYNSFRSSLIDDIKNIHNSLVVSARLLLYGSPELSMSDNNHVFQLVYKYIDNTKRF